MRLDRGRRLGHADPLSPRPPALNTSPRSHDWTTDVDGATARVALSGDWVARTDGVEFGVAHDVIGPGVRALRFDTAKLGHWDSGLIAFLASLREAAKTDGVAFDYEGAQARSASAPTVVGARGQPAVRTAHARS